MLIWIISSHGCCRFHSFVFTGALLKAALICAKVVDYPSDVPLKVQLQDKYSSGFEMEAWSNLPHGSGLYGYSSSVFCHM